MSLYVLTVWYAGLDGTPFRRNLPTRRSPHREPYTRHRIDTVDSPDDEHMAVRNM